ncbi:hypothetical protein ACFFK0_18445 [Paenibacillus chartarius]|uniref:Uncharacterized protein n=1 Tax=Paenibacillus chartarius TaxID=747481 RepID=A0ABV6DP38_9BACL
MLRYRKQLPHEIAERLKRGEPIDIVDVSEPDEWPAAFRKPSIFPWGSFRHGSMS